MTLLHHHGFSSDSTFLIPVFILVFPVKLCSGLLCYRFKIVSLLTKGIHSIQRGILYQSRTTFWRVVLFPVSWALAHQGLFKKISLDLSIDKSGGIIFSVNCCSLSLNIYQFQIDKTLTRTLTPW